jgi:hypothetical protein
VIKRAASVLVALSACLVQGCVGLGIVTVGAGEIETANPEVVVYPSRDVFLKSGYQPETTSDGLLATLGMPDSHKCDSQGREIWSYKEKEWGWSGLFAFVLIVPIPLMVPTGSTTTEFDIVKGKVLHARSKQYDAQYECIWLLDFLVPHSGFPYQACGPTKVIPTLRKRRIDPVSHMEGAIGREPGAASLCR